MSYAPRWDVEGRDWPNRECSRFVIAGDIRWHVQVMGAGPVILLVHGTGSGTHSWRDVLPLLARHYTVVAPDLPGHGFTGMPSAARMSVEGMAALLGDLLTALQLQPRWVAGHSAGAAILVELCLQQRLQPQAVISLNGAILPLAGLPGQLFWPFAKLLSKTTWLPRLASSRARTTDAIQRLLDQTGSTIDPRGAACYRLLASHPSQVAGALAMVANWDLRRLVERLPRLKPTLVLVTGSADGTVPPTETARVRAVLPQAIDVSWHGLGHLAHEERPDLVASLIEALEAGEDPRKFVSSSTAR